MKIYRE